MSTALPADFPATAREALAVIAKVNFDLYNQLVDLIKLYWGDVDSINKAINGIWIPERRRLIESMNRMDVELKSRFTGQDAVQAWEGGAREEYVKWRSDFQTQTLEPIRENLETLRGILHNAAGTVSAVRTRLILVIIEIAAVVGGSVSGPEGWIATAAGLAGLLASWLEYEGNVKRDLGQVATDMAMLRDKANIGRGPNALALPFKSSIIGDWDNWEHEDPKQAK